MGDVYLAEDTKLDRKIALKILPPELAESEERRARFKREAKAIAALNHPNIVQVYSVEEADGVHFITMEHVTGKTLSVALPRHGFSLRQFLDLAIPLTEAVAAAHENGITHRDLKPDNLIVTAEGRIKVLDFGLAKPSTGFGAAASDSDLPTEQMTKEGQILGTVAYMSPEQAEGKSVDARSDVFALGVNFYEMLTGERPFQGDTPASTLSAVLKDEPRSLTELVPSLPRDIARIVKHAGIHTFGRSQGRAAIVDGARAVAAARHRAYRQTVPGKGSIASVPDNDRRAQRARRACPCLGLRRGDGGRGCLTSYACLTARAPVDSDN